jgi:poly(hydroxyalkanoate) depolymerase family esterase
MRGKVRAAIALGAATVLTVAGLALARPAAAASLVEVTNFGANPTNLRMHLYVPDRVAAPRPPVLLAVHYCTGSGPALHSGTQFAQLADQYGFIVIYPSATRSGNCFDVSSQGALNRSGNSDPVGLISMVRWVIQNRNGDSNRVYVTGVSSGAMMTNVLLATYPDVFKAGAAFAGVPHACFATTDGSMWNSQCAQGQRIMTAQQWGDLVRNAFPGYTGARPRMQLFHGTADDTLRYPNFGEEIKQWTNVLGVSGTPTQTDTPQAGWTRTRYGGTGTQAPVEGVSLSGVGHNIPLGGQAAMAIAFFGLNTSPPTTTTTTTRPPTTTTTTTRPPTTTTTSTRPPTTSTTNPVAGCTASYSAVGNPWPGGYQGQVRVTNNSVNTLANWRVTVTLSAGTIAQIWGGRTTSTSSPYSVTNESYTGNLPPNGSATFGFIGAVSGSGGASVTVACTPA